MKHWLSVKVAAKKFSDYQQFNKQQYRQIVKLASRLKGTKIYHLNSAAAAGGGGVAELLKNQIPLERSLGLDSQWLVIKEPVDFFVVTKKIPYSPPDFRPLKTLLKSLLANQRNQITFH